MSISSCKSNESIHPYHYIQQFSVCIASKIPARQLDFAERRKALNAGSLRQDAAAVPAECKHSELAQAGKCCDENITRIPKSSLQVNIAFSLF